MKEHVPYAKNMKHFRVRQLGVVLDTMRATGRNNFEMAFNTADQEALYIHKKTEDRQVFLELYGKNHFEPNNLIYFGDIEVPLKDWKWASIENDELNMLLD